MKVVIVCDLVSTFLRFRRFIAQRLADAGHDVTIIASDDDVDCHDFFDMIGFSLEIVTMDRTSVNPLSDLSYYRRLREAIERIQPDRLLAYQAKAAVWSAVSARLVPQCHVSILFPGLGYLFAPNPTVKQRVVQAISRQLYRFAFQSIGTAIFQNPDDAVTLREHRVLPMSVETALVNGSGVCLDQFPDTVTPTSPMKFVMATRLLADKGIREFADVAGDLRQRYGDRVCFEIAGGLDTNPTAIRQAEIDEWESKGWIRYRGQISDMVTFLQESSVFVLPSYYMEGTPRSILEAMSIGRAIVTTDNRGCRETVEDGTNGFIVRQRDRDSLRNALVRCIEDPMQTIEMGKQSRRMAEEKYDVNLVCEQMLTAMRIAS